VVQHRTLEGFARRFAVALEAPSIAKVFDGSVERMPADLRLLVSDPAGDGVYPNRLL
jgi:hypothetical protein